MEVEHDESLVLPFTSHSLLFVTLGLGEAHVAGCFGGFSVDVVVVDW